MKTSERLPTHLIDLETCPLRPFLEKMGQMEVASDNVELFRTFSAELKKHEDYLRIQRQEFEQRSGSYRSSAAPMSGFKRPTFSQPKLKKGSYGIP